MGSLPVYEFDHSPFMEKVDPVTVGEKATFFAVESDNGKEIATGEYDILLSPLAYGELLGNVFVPALSGRKCACRTIPSCTIPGRVNYRSSDLHV